MIPDEAVEAAAKVMYAQDSKWEDLGEFSLWVYEHDAREVLEAAAPIIRAQALEDAADQLEYGNPVSLFLYELAAAERGGE